MVGSGIESGGSYSSVTNEPPDDLKPTLTDVVKSTIAKISRKSKEGTRAMMESSVEVLSGSKKNLQLRLIMF